MVATINTVLNQLLASNFSDVTKAARTLPKELFPLTSGNDAAQAQNKVPALSEQSADNQQRAAGYQQQQARQQSLKDLNRPQVALSPSDELALFASPEAAAASTGEIVQSSFVSDETNRARRQALVNTGRDNLNDVLKQRAQQAVSSLYARNNDIVYNANPIVSEAA